MSSLTQKIRESLKSIDINAMQDDMKMMICSVCHKSYDVCQCCHDPEKWKKVKRQLRKDAMFTAHQRIAGFKK